MIMLIIILIKIILNNNNNNVNINTNIDIYNNIIPIIIIRVKYVFCHYILIENLI